MSSSYEETISDGLSMAMREAPIEEAVLDEINLVVFSDHHRGTGDGADDFRKTKNIYHAALGYYDSLQSHLYLLGDVEELWERLLFRVIEEYQSTLELEQRFFERGAAVRFVGNHDEMLRWPFNLPKIEKFLHHAPLHDALRLRVFQEKIGEGEPLGELFFAHGHQGVGYNAMHRFLVRTLWAPLQKLTGMGVGVPSSDHRLRMAHEQAMYNWTTAQPDPVLLVCGHTHHPVFMSTALEETVREELEALIKDRATNEQIAMKQAQLQWVLADSDEIQTALPHNARPCYFNTGCCSFYDGTITGLEISDGRMRLVRWMPVNGRPERIVLREATLSSIFRKCAPV